MYAALYKLLALLNLDWPYLVVSMSCLAFEFAELSTVWKRFESIVDLADFFPHFTLSLTGICNCHVLDCFTKSVACPSGGAWRLACIQVGFSPVWIQSWKVCCK